VMAVAPTVAGRVSPCSRCRSSSPAHAIARRLPGRNGTATARKRDRLASNIAPEKRDQIVRTNRAPIERVWYRKHALLAAQHVSRTACSDRDSPCHGVSDPSGQARGHCGRAQRGRSRHGFLPLLLHRHVSGRQRAPPVSSSNRALRAKSLRTNEMLRSRRALAATLAWHMEARSLSDGGRPHFRRSAPRSSSAVGCQATSTSGER
jgi:hypothetical protein